VVLADCLYGESPQVIRALPRHPLEYVVAIRSHHGAWMRPGQRLRQTRCRPFARVFTDGSSEHRVLREPIDARRHAVRDYPITTDPATVPPETTWDLMTNQPGTIEQTVGNPFGLRTWVEYGCKHSQDDRGWTDDRLTDAASIARWWERVMSADPRVSLQSADCAARGHLTPAPAPAPAQLATTQLPPVAPLAAHPAWDTGSGWTHQLNNLRLLLQPSVCSCLLFPWLPLVPLPHVQAVQTGLAALGSLVDTFRLVLPT